MTVLPDYVYDLLQPTLNIGGVSVLATDFVCNIGVMWDSSKSMQRQLSSSKRSAYFYLYHQGAALPSSRDRPTCGAHPSDISRVGYVSSQLGLLGLSRAAPQGLQVLQNGPGHSYHEDWEAPAHHSRFKRLALATCIPESQVQGYVPGTQDAPVPGTTTPDRSPASSPNMDVSAF